jgi:type IV secretion system protein VirB10
MPLPSLGHIEPPKEMVIGAASPGPLALPVEPTPAEAHLDLKTPAVGVPPPSLRPAEVGLAPPSRSELVLARRLSGEVLARGSEAQVAHGSVTRGARTSPTPEFAAGSASPETSSGTAAGTEQGEGSVAPLFRAPATPAVPAALLPTQRFLLPQGSFIDCTLETAIDSTLPGMTTCITAADTFGADGKVVLLERGTKLVGETRGQVRQGQARVFVLWTQARTPGGVIVPLASPGTDELGRAGLPGEVDRHFWERFGSAMLITLVDGAVQAGVQAASSHTGSVVVYAPASSQDVLTEVLKETVAIPPTVVKHNGDRIQVLVARDLDFRPVYELRTTATAP